jgi:hypothetical protein
MPCFPFHYGANVPETEPIYVMTLVYPTPLFVTLHKPPPAALVIAAMGIFPPMELPNVPAPFVIRATAILPVSLVEYMKARLPGQ